MIAPHRQLLDAGNRFAEFLCNLRLRAVVIKAHHGGELRRFELRRVFHGDEAIGVGRIADHQHLDVAAGDFGERFALRPENFAVGFEQILALHAGAARTRADEQGVFDVLEGDHRVAGRHHAGEQRKRAVIKFHHDAAQRLLRLLVRDLQQLQNNGLVFAEHFAGCNAEQQAVADLAGRAGDGYANRTFHFWDSREQLENKQLIGTNSAVLGTGIARKGIAKPGAQAIDLTCR